jgi:putative membrane protein
VSAMVIFSIAYIVPGVHVNSFSTALVVALVLGIVNAVLKPVLVILTLPITIFTLGIFYLILNAILIIIVSKIVPGFLFDNFFAAFIFATVLSLVNTFIHKLLP